ncbi:unnamed protein product [Linum trigynum]|uniref:Gnk2-homologous domain-containing protein n=1 Tax=Linum trigynum TaxID=586398 RepID=A0AAV2E2F7_9ROSI
MANYSFIPFFLPLLFVLIATTGVVHENVVVKGDPDLTLISAYCGWDHDASVLKKVQARRATDRAINMTRPAGPDCTETEEKPIIYAWANCLGSVSREDCKACLVYAQDQLLNYNICHDQYGAQISLVSCAMRYETSPMAECQQSSTFSSEKGGH